MNRFAFCFAVVSIAVFVVGCKPSGDDTKSAQEPAASTSNVPAGGDGGSTIAPMAGVGAGPMAPVSRSESLQGGGSGVGQVMKERAKGMAAQSPSSVNQMSSEDGN